MSGFKLLDDSSTRSAPDVDPRPHSTDRPLGMTVHAMPSPAQAMEGQSLRPGPGRWKMLIVLLVCAAPVVASYLTFYVIKPQSRQNFGELIEPQRPLPDLKAKTLEGDVVNLRALKDQWLLVSVAGGACDQACQARLYMQRQMRETLGREKDRLDWVWLVSDDAPVDPTMQTALSNATVLRVPTADLLNWLQPATGRQLADHLYVVDPWGNWMMRFPASLDLATAPKAKRDVERLLRASNSWDKPGREGSE
jgi:cytochrome oxidase Cu insertion factor (SCO1/SenC/PrrC family)